MFSDHSNRCRSRSILFSDRLGCAFVCVRARACVCVHDGCRIYPTNVQRFQLCQTVDRCIKIEISCTQNWPQYFLRFFFFFFTINEEIKNVSMTNFYCGRRSLSGRRCDWKWKSQTGIDSVTAPFMAIALNGPIAQPVQPARIHQSIVRHRVAANRQKNFIKSGIDEEVSTFPFIFQEHLSYRGHFSSYLLTHILHCRR